MEDVSARTGLPLDQLDALEAGAVVRIPDRVAILKTLRRYADFLGLPGERFVVVVVDHWPVSSSVASSTTSYRPSPVAVAPAGTVAHAPVDTGMVPMATQVAPAGAAPPVAGRSAEPATHAVPVTVAPAANGVHTTTAQVLAVPNTGVTPAVPSPARSRAARRTPRAPHAPLALRVLVVGGRPGRGGRGGRAGDRPLRPALAEQPGHHPVPPLEHPAEGRRAPP